MQIHRLTEIVFSLLKNEKITAKILAEHFEVSTRTIYRDIDILSGAGIPIFTDKGNGGGITIADGYRLDRAILNDAEKQDILAMMSAFNAKINNQDSSALLEKLSGVFKTKNNFIEVDFSDWQNDESVQLAFNILKNSIINKHVVEIAYRNSYGEENLRTLEPLKLIFKSRDWYLYAYCRLRQENRLFKLARIVTIKESIEEFVRECDETDIAKNLKWTGDNLDIVLRIDISLKNHLLEIVPKMNIKIDDLGNLILQCSMPNDNFLYGFILSFGDKAEVMSPQWLKEEIKNIHLRAWKLYNDEEK